MNSKRARLIAVTIASVFGLLWLVPPQAGLHLLVATAQTVTPPASAPQQFDQAAAIAKLREQIKGREQEPAEKVFK